MSRFGPDPLGFFTDVYKAQAPWDIGAPQPALLELLREHSPRGPILDLGCGSGDLAIALARAGHEVVGVDFVPAAIELARRRAGALAPDAAARLSFVVGDALRPTSLGRQFGAVVDSGFFHLFDPRIGDRLVEEVTHSLEAGGRFYLLGFAQELPMKFGPRAVTQEEVRARFTPQRGWSVLACRPAEFLSRVATVPATAACVESAS